MDREAWRLQPVRSQRVGQNGFSFSVGYSKTRFSHHFCGPKPLTRDFPGGSDGKQSVYNAGNPSSSPGLGRSPGEGDGNPLQDYCLENPMEEAGRLQSMGTQRDRTERLHFLWAPLLILVLLLFLPHLQLFPSLEF